MIYQEINSFYCMTLGNEMSSFAKNKMVPGSQHFSPSVFGIQQGHVTLDVLGVKSQQQNK